MSEKFGFALKFTKLTFLEPKQ